MRFVAVKTVEQQDLQAVHRVRSSLIRERTAKANQLRGLVYEYGLVAPRELHALRRAVPEWLEDAENGLTVRFRALLAGLYSDLRLLDERVRELDREIAAIAREHEPVGRLAAAHGHRPADGQCAVCAGRRRQAVPQRSRVGRGARTDAAATQLGRQGEAAGHQQARRQVRPHAADPRSALGATRGARQNRSAQSLGRWPWQSDHIRTSQRRRSPTRWRGSPGRCCGTERTMNRSTWRPEAARPD